MNISLSVDMYKEGFSTEYISCVFNPIAAASGFYQYENYFAFSFLHGLCIQDKNKFKLPIEQYTNIILKPLGLRMVKESVPEGLKDGIKKKAIEILKKGYPAIMITKYNALFYSLYYRNWTFPNNHGIVIDGYNEQNDIFNLKEVGLFPEGFKEFKNKNPLFPLNITGSMLCDIYDIANEEFEQEQSEFYGSIYYIVQDEDIFVSEQEIINFGAQLCKNTYSTLNDFIDNCEKYPFEQSNLIVYKTRYGGYLKLIYEYLKNFCKLDTEMVKKIEEVEERQLAARNEILVQLYMILRKGKGVSAEIKQKLKDRVDMSDKELTEILTSLTKENVAVHYDYSYLDIKKYYNCQAFSYQMQNNSVADITGEGTHFIYDEYISTTEWNKSDLSFQYHYQKEELDNISCRGEEIAVDDIEADSIAVLACSEYGSYQENVEIEYCDGKKKKILMDFSDFFEAPYYHEKTMWFGVAADRKNGVTKPHSFSARIFAKRYPLENGKIRSIKLPDRHNVHIFAITLEKRV